MTEPCSAEVFIPKCPHGDDAHVVGPSDAGHGIYICKINDHVRFLWRICVACQNLGIGTYNVQGPYSDTGKMCFSCKQWMCETHKFNEHDCWGDLSKWR